jgi:riboflavin synthase
VDATGTIEEIREEADAFWVTVLYPPAMASLVVRKGSIAVDGISLTVAGVDQRRFDIQIIPFTWTHTNLQHATAGVTVNLEFDILGKYVARAMDTAAH